MTVQPRTLLTADDIRSVGFRPDAGAETVDDHVAHVWYPSSRRGERWDIGLGLYGAPDLGTADRYWEGLVSELTGAGPGVERVAVGDQAIHAEGWLYLRHRGHVLWIAVEGPDPVLARWTVERLARAVCPRVGALPPPDPTAEPDPGADPARGEPPPPPGPISEVPPGRGSAPEAPPEPAPVPLEAPVEPAPGPVEPPVPPAAGPGEVPVAPAAGPGEVPVAPAAGPGEVGVAPAPGPVEPAPGPLDGGGPVLRPRVTTPGRYRRRHLANAGLAVVDDVLVVVDARGREHRLALDGTAEAPAAIGLTVDPRRPVTVAYLAVLDGNGRLLVRDGELAVWALDDIRRFAAETGLRYLEPGPRADRIDWEAQPVELEGTPWAFILVVVAAIAVAVALAVAGLPALAVIGGAVATVLSLSFLATRRAYVRVTPPPATGEGTSQSS